MGMAVFQSLVSVPEQTTGKPMLVRASSKVLEYQLSGYLLEQELRVGRAYTRAKERGVGFSPSKLLENKEIT